MDAREGKAGLSSGSGWDTFVPRLSTMRVLIPQRDIQLAIMRPAGPAPTMRTSTSESASRGAMTGLDVEGSGLRDEGEDKERTAQVQGKRIMKLGLCA